MSKTKKPLYATPFKQWYYETPKEILKRVEKNKSLERKAELYFKLKPNSFNRIQKQLDYIIQDFIEKWSENITECFRDGSIDKKEILIVLGMFREMLNVTFSNDNWRNLI